MLWENTPSNMAAFRFKYNTWQLRWGEFSLAQWLWYWLFNQAALVQILSRSYVSAMHLFIYFFITNLRTLFVRKDKNGTIPGVISNHTSSHNDKLSLSFVDWDSSVQKMNEYHFYNGILIFFQYFSFTSHVKTEYLTSTPHGGANTCCQSM